MKKVETKIIKYPNHDIYKGELMNEKPQGNGVMIYSLLIEQEERKRLIKQIKGGYVNFFHPYLYEGEWKNGLYHGSGLLKYTTGSIYEGDFKQGEYNNHGKLVRIIGIDIKKLEEFLDSGIAWADFMLIYKERKLNNFEIYEGDWKNGKKHGDGLLIRIDYKDEEYYRYDGEWKNGKKHGEGALKDDNPRMNPVMELVEYKGEWRNDQPHGYGIGKYLSQLNIDSKYEGQYKNGVFHGKGKLQSYGMPHSGSIENISANLLPSIVEGEFKDGKLIS